MLLELKVSLSQMEILVSSNLPKFFEGFYALATKKGKKGALLC